MNLVKIDNLLTYDIFCSNSERISMADISRSLKIGIIGAGGMVGGPHKKYFESKGYKRGTNLFCYDTSPTLGLFDDITQADIVWVAVPTPPNPDGSCNISIVESVVSKLHNKIVVIKSTVPPGTTEYLQKKYPDNMFLFNPEFLTEAQAWEDFLKPSRQIVGFTEQSRDVALTVLNLLPPSFYQSPWASSTYVIRGHSATDAEMIKYLSNVFGAMKVGFANMAYDVCDAIKDEGLDVDYERVRDALGADVRIGPAWLDVSHGSYRGFGGYCFPKDLLAYIHRISNSMTSKLSDTKMSILVRAHNFFM